MLGNNNGAGDKHQSYITKIDGKHDNYIAKIGTKEIIVGRYKRDGL